MRRAFELNLRLYPWYLAATWEGLSNAVWYLYLFSYKGLSLPQMALLTLLGDGVIVLAEVPTGWLADRLGRRRSMLCGIVLQALSALLFIFGDSFAEFWLALAVCGLGDTFRGGADQALLYDSCLASGARERFRPTFAHSLFVASVVMAGSQIAGGWIATAISWELPFWLEVAFSAAGFVLVLLMAEPPRHSESDVDAGDTDCQPADRGRAALMPGSTWRRLAPLVAFASLACVAPELAHFHLPAELNVQAGFTPLHLGLLFAALELLQGLGNKLAAHPRLAGAPLRLLPAGAIVLTLALGLFSLRGLPPDWLGLGMYILGRALIDFSTGLLVPLISEEANQRTPSAVRATALSLVNASTRLLPLAVLPASVWLVGALGYPVGYLLMVLMLLAALAPLLIWLRRSSDIARPNG